MDFQEIRKHSISRLSMVRWLTAVTRLWLDNRSIEPKPQRVACLTFAPIDSSTSTPRLIPFRRHVLYRFRGARSDQGGFLPWDDLTQELRLLAVNHFQSILSGIKKAGYEIPKELLRAVREYQKAVCGSGFLEAKIKAIFLPLKLIPQSLHPNKVAPLLGNASY